MSKNKYVTNHALMMQATSQRVSPYISTTKMPYTHSMNTLKQSTLFFILFFFKLTHLQLLILLLIILWHPQGMHLHVWVVSIRQCLTMGHHHQCYLT